MQLEWVETAGLGDNSYLLGSAGEAILVDPQRDVGRLLALAEAGGLRVRYVLETHVHNDYVSGAVEARAATGAEIVGPARAGYRFPFRGVDEGDQIEVGALRVVAMATPGHTPEHTSYLVFDEQDAPVGVFTGGSLMVGGAGRTDLLGPERTDELTRAQFRTLRRLRELPGSVQVLPTHGGGSFCATGPGEEDRVSTISRELSGNPALEAPDEAGFVQRQLSGLIDFPAYYREMAPINRAGPALLAGLPVPRALSPEEVEAGMAAGSWVVDGRDRVSFAAGHVPGSVNVELGDSFASYVGWVVPFNAPVVLALPEPEAARLDDGVTPLRRIGYERVEGYLEGGVEAWADSGREVRSYPMAGVRDLCEARRAGAVGVVLDVRQDKEWDEGHIPGSRHLFVGDLPGREQEVGGDGEVWVICATGRRSSIAASLLERAGIRARSVIGGGVEDFFRICPPSD